MTAEELIKALEHAAGYGMRKVPYVTLGIHTGDNGVRLVGYNHGHTYNRVVDWMTIGNIRHPEKHFEHEIDLIRDRLTEDQ